MVESPSSLRAKGIGDMPAPTSNAVGTRPSSRPSTWRITQEYSHHLTVCDVVQPKYARDKCCKWRARRTRSRSLVQPQSFMMRNSAYSRRRPHPIGPRMTCSFTKAPPRRIAGFIAGLRSWQHAKSQPTHRPIPMRRSHHGFCGPIGIVVPFGSSAPFQGLGSAGQAAMLSPAGDLL
jgi:hypothetical protein